MHSHAMHQLVASNTIGGIQSSCNKHMVVVGWLQLVALDIWYVVIGGMELITAITNT